MFGHFSLLPDMMSSLNRICGHFSRCVFLWVFQSILYWLDKKPWSRTFDSVNWFSGTEDVGSVRKPKEEARGKQKQSLPCFAIKLLLVLFGSIDAMCIVLQVCHLEITLTSKWFLFLLPFITTVTPPCFPAPFLTSQPEWITQAACD